MVLELQNLQCTWRECCHREHCTICKSSQLSKWPREHILALYFPGKDKKSKILHRTLLTSHILITWLPLICCVSWVSCVSSLSSKRQCYLHIWLYPFISIDICLWLSFMRCALTLPDFTLHWLYLWRFVIIICNCYWQGFHWLYLWRFVIALRELHS